MERDRREQIERKRQIGEAEGNLQRGRDITVRYRRRHIQETEGQRQKGTDREEETERRERGEEEERS
jgi:hypothetical protein